MRGKMLLTHIYSAHVNKCTAKGISPHPWRAELFWRNRNYTSQDLFFLFPQLFWIHYSERKVSLSTQLTSLISYQLLLAIFMAANITYSHWVTLWPILHLILVVAASQTQVGGTETHSLHSLGLLLDHRCLHIQMNWSSAAADMTLQTDNTEIVGCLHNKTHLQPKQKKKSSLKLSFFWAKESLSL